MLQNSQNDDGLQGHRQSGQVEEAVGVLVGDAPVANDSRRQVHLNGRRLFDGPRVVLHEVVLIIEWIDAQTVLAIDYFVLLRQERRAKLEISNFVRIEMPNKSK